MKSKISLADRQFIKKAATYLERPSFLIRATDLIGKPLEKGIARLPQKAQEKLAKLTQNSLNKALSFATRSIKKSDSGSFARGQTHSSKTDLSHVILTGATGAVGGFFGMAALPIELTVTTIMMLRSIASIADDFGHDIDDPLIQLDCISVFSLGSPAAEDNEINSAYYSGRIAMARLIEEAAQFVAKKTAREISQAIANKSAPILVRFISTVAARFEIVITEKVAAQSIPVIGALSGALLNSAFTDHFNSVARYHFGMKALEKEYGKILVKAEYLKYAAK